MSPSILVPMIFFLKKWTIKPQNRRGLEGRLDGRRSRIIWLLVVVLIITKMHFALQGFRLNHLVSNYFQFHQVTIYGRVQILTDFLFRIVFALKLRLSRIPYRISKILLVMRFNVWLSFWAFCFTYICFPWVYEGWLNILGHAMCRQLKNSTEGYFMCWITWL